ncbi:uncharacterized protein N7479_008837 [Penicillium vulpinum]|uniref:uncharacterized protein n=1 Tax=Penicillium vulpinum TaxID=29845 RepID=UPI0025491C3F|nr:uncharacterized protein N7479_008837 [Penicillium vulpinum]KAJ5950424.1 hypothetical protein N7479_008837 [Penicillium vulpinum]
MGLFPMLTDEWLDEHPDEREQVIREMFVLTLDCIREFKLSIILSCQCFPSFRDERWGSFSGDDVVQNLRSSIKCAERFHPAKLCYEEYDSLDKMLRQIFHSLFQPCATWKKEYNMKLEKRLDRKRRYIQTLVSSLRDHVAEYDEIRMRAISQGISWNREGSFTAEQWNESKKALDWIVQALSPDTSGKSDFRDLVKQ